MREYLRKSIHLIFGLAIAILMISLDRNIVLEFLSAGILIGFLLSDAATRGYRMFFVSPMLDLVDRREIAFPGKGALYFMLSALICLIFFPVRIAFLAVLSLSIVDGVATMAGRTWGRMKLFRGKSLEGSFAAFVVSAIVFQFFIPAWHALLLALFAAGVELFSPVDDNLIIPATAGFFLQILG